MVGTHIICLMLIWHEDFRSLASGVDANKPFTKHFSTVVSFDSVQTDSAHSISKIFDEPIHTCLVRP